MKAFVASMRLKGFKSVEGWLEVKLSRGLVALVGKNGAGKSTLLDALGFAAACPVSHLRIQRLSELQCSETKEGCEVHFEVCVVEGSTAWVSATLTADGTRQHRVDGKVKTGKEVREFLRIRGLCLEHAGCFIKQAQVTKLADQNSPAALAAVIGDSSGYSRWSEEVTMAEQELKNTRKALITVRNNVTQLEVAVAHDQAKNQALVRLDEIKVEVADLAQQLATNLSMQLAALQAQTDAEQQHADKLQDDIGQQKKQLKEKEAELAECSNETSDTAFEGHPGALLDLQRQTACLEEQAAMLKERLAAIKSLAEHQQACQDRIASLRSKQATTVVERARHHALLLKAEHIARSTAEGAGMQEQDSALQAEITNTEAQLADAQELEQFAVHKLGQLTHEVQQLRERVHRMQEQVQQHQQHGDAEAEVQRLHVLLARKGAALQEARKQQRSTQGQLRLAEAAVGLLPHGLLAELRCDTRLVHQCFRFKDPHLEQTAAALLPLSILAGPVLGNLVVPTLNAAKDLLACSAQAKTAGVPDRKLRVWALDRLQAADRLQQQRRAAQCFKPGEVILPLDLFEYDPAFQTVMLRAVGSSVIAADDSVAAQLLNKHRLSSVTLDGNVSRQGSLQGGWRRPGFAKHSPMAKKLEADKLEVHLTKLQAHAEALEEEEHALHEQLAEQLTQIEASTAFTQQVEDAKQEVNTHQDKVAAQKGAVLETAHTVAALTNSLAFQKSLLTACLDQTNAAALPISQHRLQYLEHARQQLPIMDAALSGLTEQIEDEEFALKHLQEEAEDAEQEGALLQQLSQRQAEMQAAAEKLAALHGQCALVEEEAELKCQYLQQLTSEHEQQEVLVQALEAGLAKVQACLQEMSDTDRGIRLSCDEIKSSFPDVVARLEGVGLDAAAGSPNEVLKLKSEEYKRLKRRLQTRMDECDSSAAEKIPIGEQLIFKERQENLKLFKERAAALSSAADALTGVINASKQQVVATNENVFLAIKDEFQTIASKVLPTVEVTINKTGDEVHTGVELSFRTAGGSGEWSKGLQQLSGGQRTLVSTLLLLAAAKAGARTHLILLDEIDAALDENNQKLVATLLKGLAGEGGKGCQIICVTHNAAFQQVCSTIIQMSKNENGTFVKGFMSNTDDNKSSKRTKLPERF